MKLRFDLAVDVEPVLVKDSDGKVVAIEFTPQFTRRKGQAVIVHGEATNNKQRVLDRFTLAVSGASGKLLKLDRATTVPAAVDLDADEPKATTGKETDAESTADDTVEDTDDSEDEEGS